MICISKKSAEAFLFLFIFFNYSQRVLMPTSCHFSCLQNDTLLTRQDKPRPVWKTWIENWIARVFPSPLPFFFLGGEGASFPPPLNKAEINDGNRNSMSKSKKKKKIHEIGKGWRPKIAYVVPVHFSLKNNGRNRLKSPEIFCEKFAQHSNHHLKKN